MAAEPLAERQVRIVHYRTGLDAEVIAASDAVPLAAPLDRAHVHVAAPGAGNTAGPAQSFQTLTAGVLIGETIQ